MEAGVDTGMSVGAGGAVLPKSPMPQGHHHAALAYDSIGT